jgi:two-component system OmpR family response regulator
MNHILNVLVAEDDKDIAKFIKNELNNRFINITIANDGKDALLYINTNNYDVIVLDWMMPYLDGLSLLKLMQKQNIMTPVIMLSAKNDTIDIVDALECGADDYLTKPFSIDELATRIKILHRRTNQNLIVSTNLNCGDIHIDKLSHKVIRDGMPISLQAREYKILLYLIEHKNEVVSKKMLLEHVWEYSFDPQTNVVEVHLSRLRNKLKIIGKPDLINTVRGFGYVIQES